MEKRLCLREHMVGNKEMGHGGIGVKRVAKRGLGRKEVEEKEEGMWR